MAPDNLLEGFQKPWTCTTAFLKPSRVLRFFPARNGSIISGLQKYYCKIRSSQCALIGCHPKEEQIGRCSLRGRKCCRKKK
uniref:Beta-defensin-like domain-containing protein n=1 Tax=Bos indicus x Bos taurus TaxID=30522 RepID=A0A4W2DQ83_BOBOX